MYIAYESNRAEDQPQRDLRRNIVVVGAGPVGIRIADQLSQSDNCFVTLIGNEPATPYNRVHLSSVLAGQRSLEQIRTDECILERHNMLLVTGHVVAINRMEKEVACEDGTIHTYDTLVLALGAKPALPSIAGTQLRGVFAFRSLADVTELMARRARSRRTVVLGGGFLGIEASRGMHQHATEVTLIEHNAHLLFHQLDSEAAHILQRDLEREGIEIKTRTRARMILGTSFVEGLLLGDGSQIACDTLVLATGISPNITLAKQAGLAFGRGITVNKYMCTSDPDIYAVGECTEFQGQTFGFVAPGYEQATIARNAILDSPSEYRHPIIATTLKVVDTSVTTLGDANDAGPSARSLVYAEPGVYRRINIHQGKVVGALAVGDWPDLVTLKDTIAKKRRLSWLQRLRFHLEGELYHANDRDIAQLPDSAVICSCNGVAKGDIDHAVRAGASSVTLITECTRAGATCGTCKPMLAQLASNSTALPAVRFSPGIVTFSMAALLLLSAAALLPAIPYADSATYTWHWDILWTTSEYKQLSGFTMLGLGMLGTMLTFRKRLSVGRLLGNFDGWRLLHLITGVLCIIGLLVHTGFRFGNNLNFYLMATFTTLSVAGLIMAMVIALEHRLSATTVKRMRRMSFLVHLGLCWPLPALLIFHVYKTYYF